jgi:hypothetical protein
MGRNTTRQTAEWLLHHEGLSVPLWSYISLVTVTPPIDAEYTNN